MMFQTRSGGTEEAEQWNREKLKSRCTAFSAKEKDSKQ